jgi:hypothetical protein
MIAMNCRRPRLSAGPIAAASIAFAFWVGLASPAGQSQRVSLRDRLFILSFDEQGTPKDEVLLRDIKARFKDDPPTDVVLLAHGWNNSRAGAEATYDDMVAMLQKQLDQGNVPGLDRGYSPLVIGVHWPSQAIPDDNPRGRAVAEQAERLLRNWLKLPAGAGTLKGLLERMLSEDGQRTARTAFQFAIRAYNRAHADDLDPAAFDELDLLESENLLKGIRVFTYYVMKRRAGIVGASGVRSLLDDLQQSFPTARFHLVGHSFGCKVWLSCLNTREGRPLASMTLLQGAVSSYCVAERVPYLEAELAGGYCLALKRVRGPVIATWTSSDIAIGVLLPLASRLAGEVAELTERQSRKLKLPAYWGLGARGFGVDVKATFKLKDSAPIALVGGLNSIDADGVITGHNEYLNEAVARLIWNAMQRRQASTQ